MSIGGNWIGVAKAKLTRAFNKMHFFFKFFLKAFCTATCVEKFKAIIAYLIILVKAKKCFAITVIFITFQNIPGVLIFHLTVFLYVDPF